MHTHLFTQTGHYATPKEMTYLILIVILAAVVLVARKVLSR